MPSLSEDGSTQDGSVCMLPPVGQGTYAMNPFCVL